LFGLAVRALLVPVLILAAAAYPAYRRDLRAAQERVLSGSTIIQTPRGPIEYATLGEGSPVLVLHGTGGGWDQGIDSARRLVERGFRIIAPSRFGYLRTPLPADPSPQAEADTWAAFLDTLGIARVPVLTFSAGAAPTVQLALRHPDRVSALVLFVPGAGGMMPQPATAPPRVVLDALFRSDLPMWTLMRIAPRAMYSLVAVPASLVPSLPAEERANLDRTVSNILPVSRRRLGVLNEGITQGSAVQYPLHQIAVPTLVISAADDLYNTLPVARHVTGIIRGARLMEFPTGGHLLLDRGKEVWPAVASFLKEAT
jgi:pimeloyl-ACP methyl ester carboxylesterase